MSASRPEPRPEASTTVDTSRRESSTTLDEGEGGATGVPAVRRASPPGHASLGKQTLCQLSYSRSGARGARADLHSSEGPPEDQRRRGQCPRPTLRSVSHTDRRPAPGRQHDAGIVGFAFADAGFHVRSATQLKLPMIRQPRATPTGHQIPRPAPGRSVLFGEWDAHRASRVIAAAANQLPRTGTTALDSEGCME